MDVPRVEVSLTVVLRQSHCVAQCMPSSAKGGTPQYARCQPLAFVGPWVLNKGCNVQCIVHVAGSLLLLNSTGQCCMECQAFGHFAWCVWTQSNCCTRVCKDGSVTESVDLAHYSCAECCRLQHVLWLRYFFLLTYMATARAVGFAGRLDSPVGLLVRHKSAVRCCADWLSAVSMSLGVRQD
jgi:hypothetical protein